ncbi:hypothetical protein HC031_31730 [Planosporangium thailandense]|uniref:Uncharacterized protein n=1 Tax=Planosporangium thailandense TaxID=765197 RepID=A0ABX0Y739_9ACTN|nr:hypothetical protein [Planosporangium thailandense]NJC74251.1 hypothetical protein [Planosporangium thailandense]
MTVSTPSFDSATPPAGTGAATWLGSPAGAEEPADGCGCADGDGWADRAGEGWAVAEAFTTGEAAPGGVAVVGAGEGGADLVEPAAASIVYVAWRLPVFGAEPLTTCEPVMPADGVNVTLAEQVPPFIPARVCATERPSQPKVTGPSQDGPNRPPEAGYEYVAVTGAPGAPWLADSVSRVPVAASAGEPASRATATPTRVTRAGRAMCTGTY